MLFIYQTKHFLEHVHDSSMAKLAATLESEKWNQADVSIEKQREIDKLTGEKNHAIRRCFICRVLICRLCLSCLKFSLIYG